MSDQHSERASLTSANGSKVPKEWEHLPIDHLIIATKGYCIFLDSEGDLDWETTDECDKALETKLKPGEESAMRNRAAVLQAYPTDHLSADKVRTFRVMVGEGLARGYDFDGPAALAMLDSAREYVVARSQEVARIWYLTASYWTSGLFALCAAVGWLEREDVVKSFGQGAATLGISACFGAIGGLVSVLQRVGSTPLDPSVGKTLHYMEGASRIVAGVIGAGIAGLAVKVGLFAPFLGDKGTAPLVLIALIGGVSERLLPTIVGRVESMAVDQKVHGRNENPPDI